MSDPTDATVAIITAFIASQNELPAANLAPLVNRVLSVFTGTYEPASKARTADATPPPPAPPDVTQREAVSAGVYLPVAPPAEPSEYVFDIPTTYAFEIPTTTAPTTLQPKVDPKASVFPDRIVCLHCAKAFAVLTGHIKASHGQSPVQYRAAFHLPETYPMVAPNVRMGRGQGQGKGRAVWKPEWAPRTNGASA